MERLQTGSDSPIEICVNPKSQFFSTVWKNSKPGQIPPNWDLCKSQIPISPRLFRKTPNGVRFPPIKICVNPKSQFFLDYLERLQIGSNSPIEICVNRKSQFFPNGLERLQTGSDSPKLRFMSIPNPNFSPTIWKDSKPGQIPLIEICVNPKPQFFPDCLERLQTGSDSPLIKIFVNPKSQFFPNCLERLQTGSDSPQLRFVSILNPNFFPTVWKDSKLGQIPPNWDLCKSQIPIFPQLFGKTQNRVRFPIWDLCKSQIPIFSRLFRKTSNGIKFPPIEILVNPKSQFFSNFLERLQTGSNSPQLRFV